MSSFDAETSKALKLQIDQLAATRPIPPESLALINFSGVSLSDDAYRLWNCSWGVFLISIFGGAVGGLLRTRRISPQV